MMRDRGDVVSLLAARRYLYAMYQSLFGTEPNPSQAAALSPSLAAEALDIVGLSSEEAEELSAALKTFIDDPSSQVGTYNRLFIGPAALVAPPWESVYASHSDVLFNCGTLEVRNAYRSEGFLPERYPLVADDHVALELGFMAQLGGRALGAWEMGKEAMASSDLKVSNRFLNEHLGRWIALWAERLRAAEPQACYATMATSAERFTRRDDALVREILADLA